MSREGYGIYTKSVYDAVLESATKAALKSVSVNRWLVHQEQIWPVTIASLQSKSRNGKADFMIKATAKSLPTSTLLIHKYGASIIDDVTCPLCGGDKDTQKHLFCNCPCTQAARVQICEVIARGTNMATKRVRKKAKSCWEGATQNTMKSPLGELTYAGILPTTFRIQLMYMGLTQRQIEKIGKSTANHALEITHRPMWKQRTDAMKAAGRTLTAYLRRAGMPHGVAPVHPITNVRTVTDAINKLRMDAVEAIEEG
jgi:hypothetical protein